MNTRLNCHIIATYLRNLTPIAPISPCFKQPPDSATGQRRHDHIEMAKNFSWNEKTNQAAWLLAPRSFSQSKCIPKNSLTRNGVASIHSRSALQSRLFSGSYWPGKDQIFVTRKNGQNSDPGFLRVKQSAVKIVCLFLDSSKFYKRFRSRAFL